MARIYVGGAPLHALGYVGDPVMTHKWPGGCWELTWTMAGLARNIAHPVLKRGALVEVYEGTRRVWVGILNEPAESLTSFVATGLVREAERFLAVDGSNAPTSDTGVALTQAVVAGLPWIYRGGAPTGLSNTEPQYLHQMLDVASTAAGQRWGVEADGEFISRNDPLTPTLAILPGSGVMGQSDDTYATHLYGWYYSALSGTPPVPSTPLMVTVADTEAALRYGRVAHFVDLTPRGVLSSMEAGSLIAGMLANGRARMGYSNGLDLTTGQLVNLGGTAAHLPFVKPGGMVRLFGALDPDGNLTPGASVDFILGETKHRLGSQSITVNPIGLAPRNLSDVLAVTALAESAA